MKPFHWAVELGAPVVREFTRQTLRVAKLRHPHIVQVVDAGSSPDGTPFVVMERLSGMTLEERAGGTVIPLAELLPILRGVAAGLAAAHAVGTAHGELRADNVFMADAAGYAYGFPKLLDFGVVQLSAGASALGREVAALTSDAVPPEQRLDLTRGDAQSDQFALAALAYRFLAVAELTTAVELVLNRAMSWHPARRFDSIAEFLEALNAAARDRLEMPRTNEVAKERPAPPAPEPGSLTQQFFAEGDRASASADAADADADAAEETSSLPRLPRSRATMVAALTLVLVSSVVVGWTAVVLSDVPRSAEVTAFAAAQMPSPAPASVAPAAAPARTASAALRALQPPKVIGRPNRPPTSPPPMVAPALPSPEAPPPAATAVEPSAAAAAPTSPEAELGAAAAAPPPSIDQGVTEPPEPLSGAPIEDNSPAE